MMNGVFRYSGAGQQLEALLKAHKFRGADDVRVSVLGYIQRGGSPSAFDRYFTPSFVFFAFSLFIISSPLPSVLGTRLGEFAVHMIAKGQFAHMAALRTPDIVAVSFADATKEQKRLSPTSQLVETARCMGVCVGDTNYTK